MTYSRRNQPSYSSRKINSKYRQLLVLIGVIIFGMIVSSAVNAIPSSKAKAAAGKSVEQNYTQKVK